MNEAYEIGIRLVLDNGISDGIATIRGDLTRLDAAVASSGLGLDALRRIAATAWTGMGGAPETSDVPLRRAVERAQGSSAEESGGAAERNRNAEPSGNLAAGHRLRSMSSAEVRRGGESGAADGGRAPVRTAEAPRTTIPAPDRPNISLTQARVPEAEASTVSALATPREKDELARPRPRPAPGPTVAKAETPSPVVRPPTSFNVQANATIRSDRPAQIPTRGEPVVVGRSLRQPAEPEATAGRPGGATPPSFPTPGTAAKASIAPPTAPQPVVSAPSSGRPSVATGINGTAMPRQAAPPPTEPRQVQLSGDVFLDGEYVGRWLSDWMTRAVDRPTAGPTFFDSRQSPAWGGAAIGA
jgi:hypothetical protein